MHLVLKEIDAHKWTEKKKKKENDPFLSIRL